MSIREFYQQKAYINLNGSIISAGILLVTLTISLVFSWDLPLFLVSIPFLAVSLIHYIGFVLYKNKTDVTPIPVPFYDDKQLFEHNSLLLAFAPAPALKMFFFTPDGMLAGEMREIKVRKYRWFIPDFADKKIRKRIGIYDSHGRMQGSLVEEGKRMKLRDQKGEITGLFYPGKKQPGAAGIAFVKNGKKLRVKESSGLYNDIKLVREEGEVAARLQKGWMPLEWTQYFKEANTPVLAFDYSLSQEERLTVFAALAIRYMYYDH
ncbi:hypothetical protein QNH36_14780 [Mesobacillus sp. AQ2]|jgi:hypothetical protein|uniref:hypothetical protein n=1 Tax=unclassified Mesobacillus TaxID=2675270 RepID=UPI00203F1BF5|nr:MULTISPECIES: hypothetical protein [unclassified Mesobacillus]MCM3122024.1 hypothetical protein [Mesobacillus sp. MER 33]MCM3231988.1 hypothetical protein [Mesobacillus sp. MER 48]WHX38946.1 hypothetical protein QNH36_14780 [Mesobacillus sp. AQ2]